MRRPQNLLNRCAPMVPVMNKSGKVRICVGLKRLNQDVKRERYMLPTLEDIAPQLAGATLFSSLDASSGFWQIPFDKDSARKTTFITPFGRFCFHRLPLGITSAPESSQRILNELLAGQTHARAIMNYILIRGADEDHDEHLATIFKIIHESGLKA